MKGDQYVEEIYGEFLNIFEKLYPEYSQEKLGDKVKKSKNQIKKVIKESEIGTLLNIDNKKIFIESFSCNLNKILSIIERNNQEFNLDAREVMAEQFPAIIRDVIEHSILESGVVANKAEYVFSDLSKAKLEKISTLIVEGLFQNMSEVFTESKDLYRITNCPEATAIYQGDITMSRWESGANLIGTTILGAIIKDIAGNTTKPNGNGILLIKEKEKDVITILRGKFENGKFIEGEIEITNQNGITKFTGKFENGRLTGEGEMEYKDKAGSLIKAKGNFTGGLMTRGVYVVNGKEHDHSQLFINNRPVGVLTINGVKGLNICNAHFTKPNKTKVVEQAVAISTAEIEIPIDPIAEEAIESDTDKNKKIEIELLAKVKDRDKEIEVLKKENEEIERLRNALAESQKKAGLLEEQIKDTKTEAETASRLLIGRLNDSSRELEKANNTIEKLRERSIEFTQYKKESTKLNTEVTNLKRINRELEIDNIFWSKKEVCKRNMEAGRRRSY